MTFHKSLGNGPLCPINIQHGRLYSWEDGRWFCPSAPHGGNGKFFTDQEARGAYTVTEQEVAVIYEKAARDVLAKRVTLDQAVASVAHQTKRSSASVREALGLMIKTIEEQQGTGESMADKKAAATKKKAAVAATTTAKDSSRKLEHVDASEFQRIVDELGMTNKQAAEATGAAGMGASATYIYILLHQGASSKLFAKFEQALRDWAEEHPFEDEVPEAVVEAEAEIEAEEDDEDAEPEA